MLCRRSLYQRQRSWWYQLHLPRLRPSLAMPILWSRLLLSSTWAFTFISPAPWHSLSRQSSPGQAVLGRLFKGVIPCFSVATPSNYICIFYKLSWCLHCSMGARFGVCIAPMLLLLPMMLILRCSACMTLTSGLSAVWRHVFPAGLS